MEHIKIEIERSNYNVIAKLFNKHEVVFWEQITLSQREEILSNLKQILELLPKHYND